MSDPGLLLARNALRVPTAATAAVLLTAVGLGVLQPSAGWGRLVAGVGELACIDAMAACRSVRAVGGSGTGSGPDYSSTT